MGGDQGMPVLHTSNIDDLVQTVKSYPNGFLSSEFINRFVPLTLDYDSNVDQDLSPYSQEYYDQQLGLYKEISGRELNQQDGELHPIDLSSLISAANPIGLTSVENAAEHVRSLSTMLSLSSLSGSPRVLDMGAGHGLSSEIFAFSGCKVHAVDIDPALGQLSRTRAAARNLDILRSDLNFDDISSISNNTYEAAYFFQSLHHCLRPWELIDCLKEKLTSSGIIGFVGEPINTHWWKHWGIRLDEESLFVAREHGWFESGWSHDFIRDCFARCGMELKFYTGGHAGGEIGIATRSTTRAAEVAAKAQLLGLKETILNTQALWVDQRRYLSLVGSPSTLLGLEAFEQDIDAEGVLLYGPYIDLEAGSYEFSLLLKPLNCVESVQSQLNIDVVYSLGASCLYEEAFRHSDLSDGQLIVRRFHIDEPIKNLEVRASIAGPGGWAVTLPIIRKI